MATKSKLSKAKKTSKATAKAAPKKTASKTKKPLAKKVAPARGKPAAKPAPKKLAPKKAVAKKPAAKQLGKAPVKRAKLPRAPKAASVGGFPEQVLASILKTLSDKQAEAVGHFDLRGKSALYDYLVIANGGSPRQVQALANGLRESLSKLGVRQLRIEGASEANWVLVDAGDVVVHLFRPEVREFYNLDKIYSAS